MANIIERIGLQHRAYEDVVTIEFNLQELYDLMFMMPEKDAFRKDIQQAIDKLESRLTAADSLYLLEEANG